MSIWNRVQYPEQHHVTRVVLSTVTMVFASGVVSLCITSITKLLVG